MEVVGRCRDLGSAWRNVKAIIFVFSVMISNYPDGQDFLSSLSIDEKELAVTTACRNDVEIRCVAQAKDIPVNTCLSPVPQQQTQDHVHHVLHVLVRIQLAMKSCAKEDTYSVGVAGPTARNASARRTVTVRTPRPRRPGVLAGHRAAEAAPGAPWAPPGPRTRTQTPTWHTLSTDSTACSGSASAETVSRADGTFPQATVFFINVF